MKQMLEQLENNNQILQNNHAPCDIQAKAVFCEICNTRNVEHLHHIDKNHKNNNKENLQHLCTLCHSKIHGIEPKYSEIRRLCVLYTRLQKARVAIENQIRGLSRIELEIPEYFNNLLRNLDEQENIYAKEIKRFLEKGNHNMGNNHITAENQVDCVFPIYDFLKSVKGVGPILSGKLISLIDMNKTLMVSSLWNYAGLTPDSKKKKGKKSNWNQELKMICFQISKQLVQQNFEKIDGVKKPMKYREIYDKEKVKQLLLLEEGKKNQFMRDNQEDDVHFPSSKLHCEMRARRKMVKTFLKDLWVEWRKINKQ